MVNCSSEKLLPSDDGREESHMEYTFEFILQQLSNYDLEYVNIYIYV
jgi:hypothetical protein